MASNLMGCAMGKGSEDNLDNLSMQNPLQRPQLLGLQTPNPFPPIRLQHDLLVGKSSEQRKTYPLKTGVIDYFRDALLAIAHHSWKGNKQHNGDAPLHWARGKSVDHEDCIARHLACADDEEHLTAMAWRALANLQLFLEEKYSIKSPPGAR
jgi:hypothetical protein